MIHSVNGTGYEEWVSFVFEEVVISDDGTNENLKPEDTFDNIFGKDYYLTSVESQIVFEEDNEIGLYKAI